MTDANTQKALDQVHGALKFIRNGNAADLRRDLRNLWLRLLHLACWNAIAVGIMAANYKPTISWWVLIILSGVLTICTFLFFLYVLGMNKHIRGMLVFLNERDDVRSQIARITKDQP